MKQRTTAMCAPGAYCKPYLQNVLAYGQNLGDAMPKWWLTPAPKRAALCYPTKSAAVRAFADRNQDLIDTYGGPSMEHTPAEFDAINNRYGFKGKARVKTIGKALWESLRGGPPWCLENIDLETLNETSPAIHGQPFVFPDEVVEVVEQRQMARDLEKQAIAEGTISDCFGRRRRLSNGTFRKDGHPGYVPGSRPERACVCRDKRGRFARCTPLEDVPF